MKKLKFLISILLFICYTTSFSFKQQWSFIVITDPRMWKGTYNNALKEIRDMSTNHKSILPNPEFIVLCGDMDPPRKRYRDFNRIFSKISTMKGFFPVRGNHDNPYDAKYMIKDILFKQDSITVKDSTSLNYYIDWKNVRIVVIDQYSNKINAGCINMNQIKWIERVIKSAHNADHIFISFHEPAFPRYRHIGFSFDRCEKERDEFWDMLMKYRNKVKAVFSGHTHTYSRMRIADSKSDDANNPKKFPNQRDGIFQIDCGAVGQGKRSTIVRVIINEKKVKFIIFDAERGKHKSFQRIDEWEIAPE